MENVDLPREWEYLRTRKDRKPDLSPSVLFTLDGGSLEIVGDALVPQGVLERLTGWSAYFLSLRIINVC